MNRNQWLAERKTGLGGTDISSLVGVGYGTPQTVWADKTNPEVVDAEVHPLLRIGKATEWINADLYCKRMSIHRDDVKNNEGLTRSPKHSFAFASLDFQRVDGRPVETKYTVFFGNERWGEELTDQIPFGYIPQVHWQMDAVGSDVADVSVLSGSGEHRVYQVGRDVKFMALLIEVGGEFWEKFVKTGTPPPDDWMHPAAEELTARLVAIEKERTVVLDDDAGQLAADFVRLKEIIKEAEAEADAKKSQLEILMDAQGVPRAGKAIAGDIRLSRWIVEEAYVEPKPYTRKAYAQFRATAIKPKGKR
jgi:putative phage-type endonuclease